jgi:hypothetical protein
MGKGRAIYPREHFGLSPGKRKQKVASFLNSGILIGFEKP